MDVRDALRDPRVRDFCRRWRIEELSVFGSVRRGDVRPDSDVDLLVRFAADAGWSLFDHVVMEDELGEILGRPVDILTRRAVEQSRNEARRDEILRTAEAVYVEG